MGGLARKPMTSVLFTLGRCLLRDLGSLAFGSILEGPTGGPPVAEQMPVAIGLLTSDARAEVRDTAAWLVARICTLQVSSIAPEMWRLLLQSAKPHASPEAEEGADDWADDLRPDFFGRLKRALFACRARARASLPEVEPGESDSFGTLSAPWR